MEIMEMDIQFRAFHGPSDWGWVNQQVPILRCEDTQGIMAIDMNQGENGVTVGAFIIDNITPNSVQAHFMVTNPMVLRHGFLEVCFHHVFVTCDKKIMIGQVNSNNQKAIKLDENMGFVELFRVKEGWADNVDVIIYELRKENCRFLPEVKEAINGDL